MEREIGIARHAQDTWIVLGAPLATPQPQDAPAVSRRVLELVNEARARPTRCGRQMFNATTQLKLSTALGNAALAHSLDMAARGYFEHTGADGSTPASRVTRAGYAWRVVGENLAAGVPTADEAVAGWLQSTAHCQNLMDPRFTDMGVGFIVNPKNPSLIPLDAGICAGRAREPHPHNPVAESRRTRQYLRGRPVISRALGKIIMATSTATASGFLSRERTVAKTRI